MSFTEPWSKSPEARAKRALRKADPWHYSVQGEPNVACGRSKGGWNSSMQLTRFPESVTCVRCLAALAKKAAQ